MISRKFSYCLILLILVSQSCGSDSKKVESSSSSEVTQQSNDDRENISLDQGEIQSVQYLVSSPGEVITALKKISKEVDWDNLATYNTKSDYENDIKLSLNLGVRVADALVAVNDRNARKMLEMNTVIYEMGKRLGVENIVDGKKEKLASMIINEEWIKLAAEIENLQTEALDQMSSPNKTDLIVLASIGGWLEGLKIISGHFSTNYSEEDTQLLNQGGLLSYFIQQLDKTSTSTKSNPLFIDVREALRDMKGIVGEEERNKVFTQEDAKQLSQISSNILIKIQS